MPQALPTVACSLLKESGEISLQELAQAAEEVSGKALGARWYSREYCPSTLPAGASLQAAYPALRNIQLDTPEGLIANNLHIGSRRDLLARVRVGLDDLTAFGMLEIIRECM